MPAAYYRCELKTISRNAGHSATAAAAYRSASKVQDTRTGLTHDYQRKSGVEHSAILTPEGTVWDGDRAALWNAAESAERRDNARVAREAVICFPHQFTEEERIQTAEAFGLWLANTYQVVVDVNLHRPGRGNDDRNYHAHVLFSTREYTPQGFGKKTRQLDDRECGPEEVKRIRAQWATTVNQALERAGHQERVDHRSNKEQGIKQKPQVHLGRAVIEMTKRGVPTEMMKRFTQIAAVNDNIVSIETELAALQRELQQERHREAQQRRIRQQQREIHRQHRLQRQQYSRSLGRRTSAPASEVSPEKRTKTDAQAPGLTAEHLAQATRRASGSQRPINRCTSSRGSISQATAGQGEGGQFLRWGRPLKVKFAGRWPGRYRLSAEAKQAAVEGYAALSLETTLKGQGISPDRDPTTAKGSLLREWQILKRMQQGGMSKGQLAHALRTASAVVEARHGADKGAYIRRITDKLAQQAARQSTDTPSVSQRQSPEDLRRLIGQFREYRDRERGKGTFLNGAFPSKISEAKAIETLSLRCLQRWRAAEQQQATQQQRLSMVPSRTHETPVPSTAKPDQQPVPTQHRKEVSKNATQTRQKALEQRKDALPLVDDAPLVKEHKADVQTTKTPKQLQEKGRQPVQVQKIVVLNQKMDSDYGKLISQETSKKENALQNSDQYKPQR
jgi:MobA/MobL family